MQMVDTMADAMADTMADTMADAMVDVPSPSVKRVFFCCRSKSAISAVCTYRGFLVKLQSLLLHNLLPARILRIQTNFNKLPRSLNSFRAPTEPMAALSFSRPLNKKVVKEQTGALRREEDRRKAVESALARLRNERRAPFLNAVHVFGRSW